jgi:hypothetical protein
MQTVDAYASAGRCVMATVPDEQPAGIDVVAIAVSAPVPSVTGTPGPIVVGLGGGPVTRT